MFFQTRIKKVDTFSAVDVSGRRLTFIGNLPCQAGDFVWTDGRIIFGNTQPQAAPYFFNDSTGGVPVLSDNLRGYFDKNGNLKNYRIANDSWIVNDDKHFAHGNSNIYDAEISFSGDLLTAELINSSLMRVYKNNELFYTVDANSISGLHFIDDTTISAVYDAEFVNFKLLRDGTYDALVKPVATVTPDSGGDEGGASGEVQTTIIDQLFTRDEFLAADFPFEHTEYGGHPLLKKALLTFWEMCLFADYQHPSDGVIKVDRNFYRGEYSLTGQLSKIWVEIWQTTQDTDKPTINIQGGISRVSNGAVTARKKTPADQSFISGEIKGAFGETGNEDDITYADGNFFNVTSAVGTVVFVDGGILAQQTRVKKYLLQPFNSRDECLWLNPSDGEYYPLPEYYKESSYNRIWRDPNGRSIPLNLFYPSFTAYDNSNADFYFYETQDVAAIDDTVTDDEYGLTYRFRLVYDTQVDNSTTTITTPYFMLAIKGKYKQYTRKTIDTSGGGSDTGGSAGTTEYLTFPVQDGFYFHEQFDAVLDSDSNVVFTNDNFSIEDKLSATQLKGGKFLVGKKDSALFLVNDGQAEKSFDGCNNFRLRYLKNVSKARK